MHEGGPAAPPDPYPATPRPLVVRKATPAEAAAASSPAHQAVVVAVGVAVGLAILLGGAQPGRSPLLQSIGPPLLALGAGFSVLVVRARRRAAAQAASEGALATDRPPLAIHLEPTWSGRASKVRNDLRVRLDGTDQPVGSVPMIIKADRFDPRGTLWMYGLPEAGAAVAVAPGDGRPPLLAAGPFEAPAAGARAEAHPCSDLVNTLLGWAGDHALVAPSAHDGDLVPVPSTPLPEDLAAVARPTLQRQDRFGSSSLWTLLLLVPFCLALRPNLLGSIAVTAAVWGGWRALVRWGVGWVLKPTVAVLEQQGHAPADARFVARALVSMRFGLALPPDPHAPAPVPSAIPQAEPAAAGWGYAPQPGPPTDPAVPAAGPVAAPTGGVPQRSIALAVGLVLVVLGALVYVSGSGSSDAKTVSVQATVLEAPTATGGVLLDVPQGGSAPGIDGMTVVQKQPWETHDLDPATVVVGGTVDVQVDQGCFCNPAIDDGAGGSGALLGLALVGLGVVLAVASRFLRPGANGSPVLPPRAATAAKARSGTGGDT